MVKNKPPQNFFQRGLSYDLLKISLVLRFNQFMCQHLTVNGSFQKVNSI
jgi:hypothetical protein